MGYFFIIFFDLLSISDNLMDFMMNPPRVKWAYFAKYAHLIIIYFIYFIIDFLRALKPIIYITNVIVI